MATCVSYETETDNSSSEVAGNIIQFQLRKPRQTTLRNWLQTTFLVITKVSTLNYQQWIQIMMIKFSALYCIITSSHAVTIIQYSFHQKFSQGM